MMPDIMVPMWCPRHKGYFWFDAGTKKGRCSLCFLHKLDTIYYQIDRTTGQPINENYKIDSESQEVKPMKKQTRIDSGLFEKKERKELKDWSGGDTCG